MTRPSSDYTKAIDKDPKDEVPLVNRASVYHVDGQIRGRVAGLHQSHCDHRQERRLFSATRDRSESCLEMWTKQSRITTKQLAWNPRTLRHGWAEASSSFKLVRLKMRSTTFSKVIELASEYGGRFQQSRLTITNCLKQYDKADTGF